MKTTHKIYSYIIFFIAMAIVWLIACYVVNKILA